jgi:hypothetical protein
MHPAPRPAADLPGELLVIRYQVRAAALDEHLRLLRAAYDELAELGLSGLDWTTFQLDDGLSFIDVVGGVGDPSALTASAAFVAFRSTLDARCSGPLVMSGASVIGRISTPASCDDDV